MRITLFRNRRCVACDIFLPAGSAFEGKKVFNHCRYFCEDCNDARLRAGCDTRNTIEAIIFQHHHPDEVGLALSLQQKKALVELRLLAERSDT